MRQKMPHQDPKKRIKNFSEVSLGLDQDSADTEAQRCLQCKNAPCIGGCPVNIDIPAFIKLIKEDKREEALSKIKEKNNLPAVCGRVCPQEDQCEAACVLNKQKKPINIGGLERYAADVELVQGSKDGDQGKSNAQHSTLNTEQRTKIAVVGSGPAGLTCAADLAKMGFSVTCFESLHITGGVLSYGIPEFRLPKKIVASEVEHIKQLGVCIETDALIGNTYTLRGLLSEGFKAIFIAAGAGLPQFLRIPGENLDRVYSANEFLTRVNLMRAHEFPAYATPVNVGKKIAVIGGGNVALDCSRVALRLGKDALLVYRRSEQEMPGRIEEIANAKEEGVIFEFLTQPVKILGDEKGFVKGLECIRMKLGDPDDSGRRRPLPIPHSSFMLDVDTIIVAIGQNPNPLLAKTSPDLKTNLDGTIAIDDTFMTSLPGVFAGGDITSGADTVISAMGAGKKAAAAIADFCKR